MWERNGFLGQCAERLRILAAFTTIPSPSWGKSFSYVLFPYLADLWQLQLLQAFVLCQNFSVLCEAGQNATSWWMHRKAGDVEHILHYSLSPEGEASVTQFLQASQRALLTKLRCLPPLVSSGTWIMPVLLAMCVRWKRSQPLEITKRLEVLDTIPILSHPLGGIVISLSPEL